MLVLSRKVDESIVVGHDMVIVVLGMSGNRVTLGIDAPRDIEVRRSELPPRTQQTEPEAA